MGYAFLTLDDGSAQSTTGAFGIDNAGLIVGSYQPGQSASRGFRLAPPYGSGSYSDQAPPGAVASALNGINNLGVTVGLATDGAGNQTGYILSGGTYTTVVDPHTPTTGSQTNALFAINDLGVAVGIYDDAGGHSHAYSYDSTTGAFTDITPSGGSNVVATGISNDGVICGYDLVGGTIQGFIDQAGTVTQLTGPAGSGFTEALGVNDQGLVVGEYVDANDVTHGFIYDIATASYTTIDDTTPGATSTVVYGINDQNQIVGTYSDAQNAQHGFLATLQGTIQGVTDPVAGSTLTVGPGSGGVAAGGGNAVTIQDGGVGNAVLYGNAGNDTLVALAASDIVVTGAGSNTVYTSGAGDSVFLGAGRSTVAAGSGTTVVGGGGTDAVFLSAGAVAVGGAAGAMTAIEEGNATVGGGAGGMTVFEGAASGDVFGGSGTTTFVGGTGSGIFVGGSGTALGYAGSGADVLFGGTGSASFVGGADAATTIVDELGPATVYFGNGNDVFLGGSANHTASHYGGGGADSTLDATASTGSDLFVMGGGNAALYEGAGRTTTFLGSGVSDIHGGTGADLYVQVNGQGGGTDLIRNFRIGTDLVQLGGYGAGEIATDLAQAAVVGGSTIVTLSDHTTLNFVGVTGLTAASFVA